MTKAFVLFLEILLLVFISFTVGRDVGKKESAVFLKPSSGSSSCPYLDSQQDSSNCPYLHNFKENQDYKPTSRQTI